MTTNSNNKHLHYLVEDINKDGNKLEKYITKYTFKVEELLHNEIIDPNEIESIISYKKEYFENEGYIIEEKKINEEGGGIKEITYSKNYFNCIAPQINDNGILIARTDLKNPEDVTNGYNSIKELFKKLNSITDTQIEPLYEPYYYGEINKDGEKIPTFIIVGDIHADSYGLDKEGEDIDFIRERLSNSVGGHFLYEKDESEKPEIKAVDILVEKFGIEIIGLENEFNKKSANYKTTFWRGDRKSRTGIGKGVQKKGIDYIGLEDKLLKEASKIKFELDDLNTIFKIKLFNDRGLKKEDPRLDIELTKPEFIEKYKKLKNLMLGESNLINFEKRGEEKYIRKNIKNEKEFFEKNSTEDLIDIYNINKYIETYLMESTLGEGLGSFFTKKMMKIARKLSRKAAFNKVPYKSLEKIVDDLVKKKIEYHKIVIEERNKEGIELVSEKMGENNISAMVYGKAHIPDLKKQLIEKYNGEVNIYFAK